MFPWDVVGREEERSKAQTFDGRRREDPENEGSENLTLIPQKKFQSNLQAAERRRRMGSKRKSDLQIKKTQANLLNVLL